MIHVCIYRSEIYSIGKNLICLRISDKLDTVQHSIKFCKMKSTHHRVFYKTNNLFHIKMTISSIRHLLFYYTKSYSIIYRMKFNLYSTMYIQFCQFSSTIS